MDKEFKPEVWASPEKQILHQVVKLTDGKSERDIERRQDIIRFVVENQGPVDPADIHNTSILEHIDRKLWSTPLLADEVHIKLRMSLIRAGANIYARDKSGNQVLQMLLDFREVTPQLYHELVQLIEQVVLSTLEDPEERTYIFNSHSIRVSEFQLIYTPNWDWWHDTALHLAVGHLQVLDETLELFKKYDFNWNEENSEGYTLVHVAVKCGRSMRLIKKLVECFGVDWTIPNIEARTAAHEAADAGHVEFLTWICQEYDFDINLRDNHGMTALHLAMRCSAEKRRETVAILLENGTDPNLLNLYRQTPLVQSLHDGQGMSVELLRYLKEKGANILGCGEGDKTGVISALYSTADVKLDREWNLGAVMEYLIDEGAQLVGGTGRDKRNLVHRAAGNGWLVGLQLLRKHLESDELTTLATSQDGDGWTPIYWAINCKSVEVIGWLVGIVGKMVAWESCGSGGVKPLHVCAQMGWVEGMELLLDKYGVNLREVDDEGNTALHYAHGTKGVTSLVVGYLQEKVGEGGWGEVRNRRGETPQECGKRMMKETMSGYNIFGKDYFVLCNEEQNEIVIK